MERVVEKKSHVKKDMASQIEAICRDNGISPFYASSMDDDEFSSHSNPSNTYPTEQSEPTSTLHSLDKTIHENIAIPSKKKEKEQRKRSVRFDPQSDRFEPTHTVFTPRLTNKETNALKYRKPDDRIPSSLAPPTHVSSISHPNCDDFLRRVSVVIYQHLRRCENEKKHKEATRLLLVQNQGSSDTDLATENNGQAGIRNGVFKNTISATTQPMANSSYDREILQQRPISMNNYTDLLCGCWKQLRLLFTSSIPSRSPQVTSVRSTPESFTLNEVDLPLDQVFREDNFVIPQYRYTFLRLGRLSPLTSYAMQSTSKSGTSSSSNSRNKRKRRLPTVEEIFRFCNTLFVKAQLSPECTIVSLIYIERLMEQADVPLLATNWKPILLCGLLLASKVWQDLSSWNVEISYIYPQYPLHCINRLERLFLHYIQWDLYISSVIYAKYYFALRSLTEKKDFRRRYNYTVRVDPPNAQRLEERSAAVKSELYSTSL